MTEAKQIDQTKKLYEAVLGKKSEKSEDWGAVKKAFERGVSDVVVELPWYPDGGSHQIVLQKIANNRVFFINPLGHGQLPIGTELADGQPRRIEEAGLESMPTSALEKLFGEGKCSAMITG
ncbi:MAG TPA: hypothetical protein V6C82_10580 [Chroococcales cyanobacterium]|jgi:hypothetical protein